MKISKQWIILLYIFMVSSMFVGCSQGDLYESNVMTADIENTEAQPVVGESVANCKRYTPSFSNNT